jgi:hypothetical protein
MVTGSAFVRVADLVVVVKERVSWSGAVNHQTAIARPAMGESPNKAQRCQRCSLIQGARGSVVMKGSQSEGLVGLKVDGVDGWLDGSEGLDNVE